MAARMARRFAVAAQRGWVAATTGSSGGVPRDGGARSAGVVTKGGKGCTQPRLVLGLWAGGVAGVTARRWRTGGGGRVPGGAPSASRKRRIRSSSLCAGGRGGACSLGEGGSGFSESSETCRVSHLKNKREPGKDEEDERVVHRNKAIGAYCQAPSVDGFSVAPIDSRIVVSACTFFIRT